tara:strand:+ start:98 stop:562 length:465 start_codon:yes stop_codon:yes gene_type:complete
MKKIVIRWGFSFSLFMTGCGLVQSVGGVKEDYSEHSSVRNATVRLETEVFVEGQGWEAAERCVSLSALANIAELQHDAEEEFLSEALHITAAVPPERYTFISDKTGLEVLLFEDAAKLKRREGPASGLLLTQAKKRLFLEDGSLGSHRCGKPAK